MPRKCWTIVVYVGIWALDAMCTVANVAKYCEASCSVPTCVLRRAILATKSSVVVVGSSHNTASSRRRRLAAWLSSKLHHEMSQSGACA